MCFDMNVFESFLSFLYKIIPLQSEAFTHSGINLGSVKSHLGLKCGIYLGIYLG